MGLKCWATEVAFILHIMGSQGRFEAEGSTVKEYHLESSQVYNVHSGVRSLAVVKKIPFIILILSQSLKTYFRTPRKTFYESKAKYNMLAIKWDNIIAEAEPQFSPPRSQTAAQRNASIIFQVIKAFCFDFQKAGREEMRRVGRSGGFKAVYSLIRGNY